MTAATNADASMLELDAEAAIALLPPSGMGRVAVTTGALPKILVVQYASEDDGGILFAPASPHPPGSLRGTVVAFEASGGGEGCDGCDAASWSVSVTGIATPLAPHEEHELAGVVASLESGGGVFRLTPSMVTGLRFG